LGCRLGPEALRVRKRALVDLPVVAQVRLPGCRLGRLDDRSAGLEAGGGRRLFHRSPRCDNVIAASPRCPRLAPVRPELTLLKQGDALASPATPARRGKRLPGVRRICESWMPPVYRNFVKFD